MHAGEKRIMREKYPLENIAGFVAYQMPTVRLRDVIMNALIVGIPIYFFMTEYPSYVFLNIVVALVALSTIFVGIAALIRRPPRARAIALLYTGCSLTAMSLDASVGAFYLSLKFVPHAWTSALVLIGLNAVDMTLIYALIRTNIRRDVYRNPGHAAKKAWAILFFFAALGSLITRFLPNSNDVLYPILVIILGMLGLLMNLGIGYFMKARYAKKFGLFDREAEKNP